MTTRIIVAILMLSCVLPKTAQAEDVFAFRGFAWGMPRQEVLARESAHLVKEEAETLVYWTTIAEDVPVELVYTFRSDRLVQGEYRIDAMGWPRFRTESGRIEFFRDLLDNRYGKGAGATGEILTWSWQAPGTSILLMWMRLDRIFTVSYSDEAYVRDEAARLMEQMEREKQLKSRGL